MPNATPPRLTSFPKSCKSDAARGRGGCTRAGVCANSKKDFFHCGVMAPAPSTRPPKSRNSERTTQQAFHIHFSASLYSYFKKGSSVGEEKKRNDGNISRAFLFESLFSLASNCLPNIANRCASIKEPDLHSIVVGLTRAPLAGGVEESELAVHSCLQFRQFFFSLCCRGIIRGWG